MDGILASFIYLWNEAIILFSVVKEASKYADG
jgi:hypothetical protein